MHQPNTSLLPEKAELWQSLGWQPNAQQQFQFQQLYKFILEGNRQLNLTRITEPLDFWEKHLWDSLRGIEFLLTDNNHLTLNFIDIGTGAGFPGIPVAIAIPNSKVTLLDSTRKKITFLDTLISQLGVRNVTTIIGRAEVINQQPQHRNYDIALLRAIGSVELCVQYGLPFLKVGGLAVLYRGNWTTAELQNLQSVVVQYGGEIDKIEEFITPLSHSIRHCLYLRKVKSTSRII